MPDNYHVKYPGTVVPLKEMVTTWQSFLEKFYPAAQTPAQIFDSFKQIDRSIFNVRSFLAGESYYFVISHPLNSRMRRAYRASPEQIAEFFLEYPLPGIDLEINIFSDSADWSIVNNHDGDLFLLGESIGFEEHFI